MLFNKLQTTLVQYPGGKAGGYTVPGSVITIGYSAFYYCYSLTGVTLPSSLTSIGSDAFSCCSELTGIYFQGNAPSLGSSVFYSVNPNATVCYLLGTTGWGTTFGGLPTFVLVAGTVPTILAQPASRTVSSGRSTTFSVSVWSSTPLSYFWRRGGVPLAGANQAFYTLTNCQLSDSGAQFSCLVSNVVGVTNSQAATLTVVEATQFTCQTNSGAITITGYTGSGGAEAIPSTIYGLPVTAIGSSAFSWKSSLTSITLPSSLTSIGSSAFNNTGLTDVTIPNSVTNLGSHPFGSCYSLTNAMIGSGVTSIGSSVFSDCSRLLAITVDPANSFYSSLAGVLFNKSQTTLVQYPGGKAGGYTVPGSVITIGYSAFSSCSSLTGVTLPSSVITIRDFAFYDTGLTDVTVPNSVTSIGYYAFGECSSLTNAMIGSGVTSIGSLSFSGCSRLLAITVDPANSFYSSLAGVLFNKLQTTLVQYPGGKAGGYIVPGSVITIGDFAFSSCSSLTGVTLPSSLTSIGDDAFYDTELTNVTIPNSVTTLGSYAFNSWSLTNAVIGSGVTSIGSDAFYYCIRLLAITVDPANSFYSSLAGVLFNKLQTTLVQYPGGKAGGYTVPGSVITIGDSAFDNTHLTSVTVPNSVTNLGSGAFRSCYSLTNAVIGSGVTSIGSDAFYYCSKLTGIYFQGNAPSLGSAVFNSVNPNATVYYLLGTTGWGTTFGGLPTFVLVAGTVPTILAQPASQTVSSGGSATFSVSVWSSTPLSYFWRRGGVPLAGANQAFYTLTNCQWSDSGAQFSCLVSNVVGVTNSLAATLTVVAPPVILQQPQGQTVFAGQTAVLSLTASNAQYYIWRMNGANLSDGGRISGSATPNLTIAGTLTSDSGSQLSCLVSNANGGLFSSSALLTVRSPSMPFFTAPMFTNGYFQAVLNGAPMSNYVIEASSDLGTWQMLKTVATTGGSTNFSDPSAALARRFYRARLQ